MTPGQHHPVKVSQGKSRDHMEIPPPGMIRNSGPHFDQTLDQPINGPLNFFALNIELPDLFRCQAWQIFFLHPVSKFTIIFK